VTNDLSHGTAFRDTEVSLISMTALAYWSHQSVTVQLLFWRRVGPEETFIFPSAKLYTSNFYSG
jgi:hypothetical protein